ncbi:hypothetical protein N9Y26_00640 [bacterium]|nr:hypothetical protein [bacterium]
MSSDEWTQLRQQSKSADNLLNDKKTFIMLHKNIPIGARIISSF